MDFVRPVFVFIVTPEVQQCLWFTMPIFSYFNDLGFVPIIEAWSGTQSLVGLESQSWDSVRNEAYGHNFLDIVPNFDIEQNLRNLIICMHGYITISPGRNIR